MEQNKKFYDKFFTSHSANVHNDPLRFSALSKLCNGSVLDLGCGTGSLTDYYLGEYIGVDFSDVAIKKARDNRRKDARFACCDITEFLNFGESNYDTVVISELLEHIKDDSVVISNALRLVSSGGRIIISVPNGDSVPDESHCREFTVPQLRKRFSEYGYVRFHNFNGFESRILMSIDVGEKSRNLISLVMPVKNEALGLENAILSCIDFVDEIIVSVDDTSYDDTLKIATKYADVVKIHKWEGSFAIARNFAQKGAKGKWCLCLDGHEFVDNFSISDLENLPDKDSVEIQIVLENGFKFHFPRFVRSYVMWGGDVHNYPKAKSRSFLNSFIIKHDRKNMQAQKAAEMRDVQRDDMVTTIFAKEMKKNPKSPRPYFYLGQHFFLKKEFKKAIWHYKKYLKYSRHKGERWLVCYEIAKSYCFLGHYLRTLWALRDADKETAGRWEIAKFRGVTFSLMGKYKPAVIEFIQSFTDNKGNFTYSPDERNDSETWDFIAYGMLKMNKIQESKVAWKRAIALETHKPKEKQNLERLKIMREMVKQ